MRHALVVGGGISGMAAAVRLAQNGFSTQLFESGSILGGRIGTRRHGSLEIDLGGRNFGATDKHLVELLGYVGITDLSDYRINSVSVGTKRSFDMRMGGNFLTRMRRLIANAGSAGLFDLLRLRRIANGARLDATGAVVGSPYWIQLAEANADPAAASFFGNAVADHVLRPWTLRMMAAEPEEVYLGNLGPLLGRTPGPLKRVNGGMGVFLRAAMAKLDVRLGHTVERVLLESGRATGIEGVTHQGSRFRERADVVVVATPAPLAANLLHGAPALARALREVVYRPVATVVAEYASVAFPNGVGGLFLPRGYPVSHIAKYDETMRVRFSYAGVAARRAIAECSVDELLDLGEETFRQFGGRLGERVAFTGNVWLPGLCGQSWMHHRTVQTLREQCRVAASGLALTGDYFRGNSLEACARAANENVARLLDDVGRTSHEVGYGLEARVAESDGAGTVNAASA